MKRIIVVMSVIIAIAISVLGGCGTQESKRKTTEETRRKKTETEMEYETDQDAEKETFFGIGQGVVIGIRISEGPKYQGHYISTDDIIVMFDNGKEISLTEYNGNYVTDSAAYLGDEVGVVLDGKHYSAKTEEFVCLSDINWSWDKKKNIEMFYAIYDSKGEVDANWFEGTAEYVDGSTENVSADAANVSFDKNNVGTMSLSVTYRGNEYYYTIPVADSWGDGRGEGRYADGTTEEERQKQKEKLGEEKSEQRPTGSLLCKKTEYGLNGLESVVRAYIEYEYTNHFLSKETKFNSAGEISGYTEYEYNSLGVLMKVKDYIPAISDGHMYRKYEHIYESGNEVKNTSYDSDGVGIQEIWEYKYDSKGNVISKGKFIPNYDPPNQRPGWTEYSYDEFGGLIEERQYNSKGKLSNTRKYEYEYNEQNNPLIKYEILSNGEKSLFEEYTYDNKGNLIEINSRKKSEIIRYEYNSNNDLIKESKHSYYDEKLKSWIEYEYSQS